MVGDNLTNDIHPQFRVTVPDDVDRVRLSIDGGKTWVNATPGLIKGSWDYTWLGKVPEGKHTLIVEATDIAGNTATRTLDFTVDTTLSVPTITLDTANDSGVAGDNITNEKTPGFTLGNIDADASRVVVQVTHNGKSEEVELTQTSGNWVFTPTSAWADGNYTLTVKVTDEAGNTRQSAPLSVKVDTQVTIDGIVLVNDSGITSDNITNEVHPHFRVTVPEDVNVVRLSIDGGTTWINATPSSTGIWDYTWPDAVPEGKHTLVVEAIDIAGNKATQALGFTIDATLSVPTITLDTANDSGVAGDNITNEKTPGFTINGIDADAIRVAVQVTHNGTNQEVELTQIGGQWHFTPASNWVDGNYTLTVKVEDRAGNVSQSAPLAVTIDTQTEINNIVLVNDTGMPDDNLTNALRPEFRVTVPEDVNAVRLSIDGGKTWVDAKKTSAGIWDYSWTTDITEGVHTLTVEATDIAGNTATRTLDFTVDTTLSVPTITLDTANDSGVAGDNITNEKTPGFTINGIDTDASRVVVTVTHDGKSEEVALTKNGGGWTFTPDSAWTDGRYTLTVTVEDDAGNIRHSAPLAVTVDTRTAINSIELVNDSGVAGDNLTNEMRPHFRVEVPEDVNAVRLSIDGGKTWMHASKSAAGVWDYSWLTDVLEGTYTLAVEVTDIAGNTATRTLDFTIDTTLSMPTITLDNADDTGERGDNLTNRPQPNFILQHIDADVASVVVSVTHDGTTSVFDASQEAGGWRFTPDRDWTDGSYTLSVTVTDKAGNVSQSTPLTVTVDTHISIGKVELINDSGVVGDNMTNDIHPQFRVTVPEDVNSVRLSIDGGATWVKATQGAAGIWDYTWPDDVKDGKYTLQVEATDKAGNTITRMLEFTIDTTLTTPTIALDHKDDSGITGDNLTNAKKPGFILGNIDVDASRVVVQVTHDGKSEEVALTKSGGQWSFTPTAPWGDGSYTLTVTVEDKAGNVSHSAPLTVTVDTQTAINSIELVNDTGIPDDNLTNAVRPHFRVTVPDDVNAVRLSIDGGKTWVDAKRTSAGVWDYSWLTDVTEGAHTLTVEATDVAGNTVKETMSFTVDTTLSVPLIALDSADDSGVRGDELTRVNRPTFLLDNIDNDARHVTVEVQHGSTREVLKATQGANGRWSFTPAGDWADGQYTLTVKVEDEAGNIRQSAPLTVTVDTQTAIDGIELVNDHGISGDNLTNALRPEFRVTTPGDVNTVRLSLDGDTNWVNATKNAAGVWEYNWPGDVGEGKHTLTVEATDAAGNTATRTLEFTIDTTLSVPVITLDSADDSGNRGDNVTSVRSPGFTIENIDPDANRVTVQIAHDGSSREVELTQTGGRWHFTPDSAWTDGSYTLTVKVEDNAGNIRYSTPLDVKVDTHTSINHIELVNDNGVPDDNLTNEMRPQFRVTVPEDVTVVRLSLDGSGDWVNATAGATKGEWNYSWPSDVGEGKHVLTVEVTDAAGNTATKTLDFRIDTRLSEPVITLNSADDTGVPGDGLTSRAQPSFTLQDIDADVVRVTVSVEHGGRTETFDVLQGAGGWIFTPAAAWTDGSYTLKVTVEDEAGNIRHSAPLDVKVDTQTAIDRIELVNDSGEPADNLTNDVRPEFRVTVPEDVNRVRVSLDGGKTWMDATKASAGVWSYTWSSDVTEGAHVLTVEATDIAGNTATRTLDFTIDTTLSTPTIELDGPDDTGVQGDNLTNRSQPTFILKDVDPDAASVMVSVNHGGTTTTFAATNGAGGWRFTPASDWTDGAYTLSVTVTDKAGNVSHSAPLTVNVDTHVTIDSIVLVNDSSFIGDNLTNEVRPHFRVTVPGDVNVVRLSLNDGKTWGNATQSASGDWEYIWPDDVTEGKHTLTVEATDIAGNKATQMLEFIIDTTLSTPTITLDAVDDSGVAGDNITNEKTPGFTINGIDADASQVMVVVTHNGKSKELALTQVSGRWHFTPDSDWTDGNYTLTVKVEDKAGNMSQSSPLTVTVDTQTVISSIVLVNDSGIVGDKMTNNVHPHFRVTVPEDVNVVRLSIDGGTTWINATPSSTGIWDYTWPDAVPEGKHTLVVEAIDIAGNKATQALGFTIDATLSVPTITLDTANDSGVAGDNITNEKTPGFTINGIDADAIRVAVQVTHNGTNQEVELTQIGGQWHFTPASNWVDGNYTLTVKVEDRAGNVSQSAPLAVTIDTQTEINNIVLVNDTGMPDDNLTNALRPEFRVTVPEDVNAVRLSIDGGKTWVDAKKTSAGIWDYSWTTDITEGVHTLTVEATDIAGNTATRTLDFTVDTTLSVPTITLDTANDSGVAGDNITNEKTPGFTINGIDTDASRVVVTVTHDGKSEEVALTKNGGGWTFTPDSAWTDGRYTLTVTVEDDAGNIRHSAPLAVTVDTRTAINSIELVNDSGVAGDNLTNEMRPHFRVEVPEDVNAVRLSIDGGKTWMHASKSAAGVWDYSWLTDVLEGTYTLAVEVTDIAGNTATRTLDFTIDTTLSMPTITLDNADDTGERGDNLTNRPQPNFILQHIDADVASVVVSVTHDGTTSVFDASQEAGGWRFTPDRDWTDGSYTLSVTVTDKAGNVSQSTPLTVTVDTHISIGKVELINDSGVVGDNMTNDIHPQFRVTVPEDVNSVRLSIDGGATWVKATQGAAGIWDYTWPDDVKDGKYTLQVEATDKAGNTITRMLEFTIDTTLTTPTIALDHKDDSGITGDNLTNAKKPGFILGNIDVDASRVVVQVTHDGKSEEVALTKSGGQWSFTPTAPWGDGSYTLTVTVEDKAGNVSHSAPLTVTVDTQTAINSIELVNDTGIPDDNLTNAVRPHFRVTVPDDVNAVRLSIDGGKTWVDAKRTSAGVWDYSWLTDVTEGAHTLTVEATDVAGNTVKETMSFTVDTTLSVPLIALDSADDSGVRGDELTRVNRPTFLLDNIDNDARHVTVEVQHGSTREVLKATQGANGRWSFTPAGDWADGQYTLTVKVEDEAGNIRQSAPLTVTVDTQTAIDGIELVNDHGISGDNLTNALRPEFRVTTPGDVNTVRLSLDGDTNWVNATKNAAGVWEYNWPGDVGEGKHTLTVEATDAAGNTATRTLEFTIDTTLSVPVITLDSADDSGNRGDNVTSVRSPGFTIENIDPDANRVTVQIAHDGSSREVELTQTGGRWHFTPDSAWTDGSYTLTVKVEDNAGNIRYSTPLDVKVDTHTSINHIELVNDNGVPDDNLTNEMRPQFRVTVPEDVTVVRLSLDGSGDWVNATAGATKGEWNYSWPSDVGEGKHVLTVEVTDAAGNTATKTLDFRIDTRLSEPVITLNSADDTGVPGDGLTSRAQPSFTLQDIDADVVRVTVSVEHGGRTETFDVLQGAGGWIFTPAAAWTDGSYTLKVTVEDEAGNIRHSAPLDVKVDTQTAIDRIELVNDSGEPADNLTNDVRPEFRVTVPEDVNRVRVSLDGGKTWMDATKASAGVWSYTWSSDVTEGAHVLTVEATDIAGNTATRTLGFTIDTTLSTPTIELAPDQDTGQSKNDNLTSLTQPVFVLGHIDNDVQRVELQIEHNGTFKNIILTESADGWRYRPDAALNDGSYKLTVTVTDTAGNKTTSAPLTVTIDSTLSTPVIALANGEDSGVVGDQLTNHDHPVFDLSHIDSDALHVMVRVTHNDSSHEEAAVFNNGKWSFSPSVSWADGLYQLAVVVEDRAGNVKESAQLDVRIDTTTTINNIVLLNDTGVLGDQLTNNAKPSFRVEVPADVAQMRATLDGGTTWIPIRRNADGQWIFASTNNLTDGQHTLRIEATDTAGNVASKDLVFNIDTHLQIPTIALGAGQDTGANTSDHITNISRPTFVIGNVDADVIKVMVTIGTNTYNATKVGGTWEFRPDNAITDGSYNVSVTIEDKAGNIATSQPLSIMVDTRAEINSVTLLTDSGDSSSDNITNVNKPQFEIVAANDTVQVRVKIDNTGNWIDLTQSVEGHWEFNVGTALPDGQHSLLVEVVDVAGNVAQQTLNFTVDTTLREPNIVLDPTQDTGDDSNDNITNINKPTFIIGNVDNDVSHIVIHLDGRDYIIENNGAKLTFTPDKPLTDGHHTLTVTVTDIAGNTKTSAELQVEIDTQVQIDRVSLTTDSGVNDSDRITNVARPSFNIVTPDDVTKVLVSFDGVNWSPASKNAAGQWDFTAGSALLDGHYVLHVQATDRAGNTANSSLAFTVDTHVDGLNITMLDDTGNDAADRITNITSPRFEISARESLQVVTVTLNGNVTTLNKGMGNKWIYTPEIPLLDGHYKLEVTAEDIAGNTINQEISFTIDTTVPVPDVDLLDADDSGESAVDNITNVTKPRFIISDIPTDIDTVTIKINGVSYPITLDGSNTGTFQVPVALKDGVYEAVVVFRDLAGNISETKLPFTIDTATSVSVRMDPTSDTGSSNSDNLTNRKSPKFGGTAEPDAKLVITIIDDTSGHEVLKKLVTVGVDGNWSMTPDALADGIYTIKVVSTDVAGNTAEAQDRFTIDTVTPDPTIQLTDSSIDDMHEATSLRPEFKGIAEAFSTIMIQWDGKVIGSANANSNGEWSWTPPSILTPGSYVISIVAKDKAGNESSQVDFPVVIPVIDVTPPTIKLSDDSDSGALGDFITNDKTPTLIGSTLPNTIVSIYIDGKKVGEATSDTAGRYAFQMQEQPDGTYVVEVGILNPRVNEEIRSAAVSLVIDTQVADLEWHISGIHEDKYINTVTPEISGISEPNSKITVFVNGIEKAAAYTTAGGHWGVILPTLGNDGNYVLKFKVEDIAGNVKEFGPQEITLDTVIAPLTVTLREVDDSGKLGDWITNKSHVNIDGTAEAGSTLTIKTQGGVVVTTFEVGSDGHWSAELDLSNGNNIFVVESVDKAGNSQQKELLVEYDTQIEISAISLSRDSNSGDKYDLITNDKSPELVAMTEPGATVQVYINDVLQATVEANSAGNVSYTMPANSVDGNYHVQFVATDIAGNRTESAVATVTIDSEIAVFTIDEGSLPTISNSRALSVAGQGEAGAQVSIFVDNKLVNVVMVEADGSWRAPILLQDDGTFKIHFSITDIAGNTQASKNFSVDVDSSTEFPTITLEDSSNSGLVDDLITNHNTPSFVGTAEAGATIHFYVDEKIVANILVQDDGRWSYQFDNSLKDGEYSIRVVAEDTAGNRAESPRLIVTIDTSTYIEPPTLTAGSDNGMYINDGVTSQTRPQFSINGEFNQSVQIYIDGKLVDTVTVTDRNQVYQPVAPLGDGSHSIYYVITDKAGNTATSKTLDFSIDTSNKTPVVIEAIDGHTLAEMTGSDGKIYITDTTHNIIFRGSAEPDSLMDLTINGLNVGQVWVSQTGEWQMPVNSVYLSQGLLEIKIKSTDRGGNVNEKSYSIWVDTMIEDFTSELDDNKSSSQNDWWSNNTLITMRGLGEAGATVSLVLAGVTLATTVVAANGQWALSTDQLPEGKYDITLSIEDNAGNRKEEIREIFIDRAAPVAPAITYSDIVDDLVIMKGTGEAKSKLTITDSEGNIYTLTVPDNGNWSMAIPYPSEGKFTISSTDRIGNTSDVVSVDLIKEIPTISLAVDSNSGSKDDNITHDKQPTFIIGNLESDIVNVQIDINGMAYNAEKRADGVWFFTPDTALVDGTYTISVTANDAAGNQKNSLPITVTIDTTLKVPEIALAAGEDTGTSGSDNVTNHTQPKFTLQHIDADVTGVTVSVAHNGTTDTYPVTKGDDGWSFSPSAAWSDGSYTLSVTVVDGAGNTQQSSSLTVTVDSTLKVPEIALAAGEDTGTSDSDNVTNHTQPKFTLQHIDADVTGVTVSVAHNGTTDTYPATKGDDGWSFSPSAAWSDGSYTLSVTVVDGAGNTQQSSSLTVTVDSTITATAPVEAGDVSEFAMATDVAQPESERVSIESEKNHSPAMFSMMSAVGEVAAQEDAYNIVLLNTESGDVTERSISQTPSFAISVPDNIVNVSVMFEGEEIDLPINNQKAIFEVPVPLNDGEYTIDVKFIDKDADYLIKEKTFSVDHSSADIVNSMSERGNTEDEVNVSAPESAVTHHNNGAVEIFTISEVSLPVDNQEEHA
ncbi:Ig-like domain repeat protein [Salmonella enterica subsp. diarizonae serovar 50:k:z str. MZ0080]|nr:Ig-like domain repeat protein [Salmonella enterica subsp. diarizonae serovar 50:k:z str. MZ0080]